MPHVYHESNSSSTKEANTIFATNANDDDAHRAH
jgi:hypothetical protein